MDDGILRVEIHAAERPVKLPAGCTADRDCLLGLASCLVIAASRPRFRLRQPDCPVRRPGELRAWRLDRLAGWSGAEGLTASLGEPHPLGAGMDQAMASEAEGNGSTHVPAGDH
jgi:hypothetical protein